MRRLPRALVGLALGSLCVAAGVVASPRSLAPPESPKLTASSPLDAAWSNKFGLPIPNGMIRAIASFGGQTIIAGTYTQAASTRAHRVAAWDGTTWQALGGGLPWSIEALVVYDGQLIAAGSKPPIVPSGPSVYAWNGTTWTAIGSSDKNVHALAVYGGELYAGGDFNTMDGVAAERIARWDGAQWSAAGSGITGTSTRSVKTLTVWGTKLVAAGSFASLQSIAAWDGASWSMVGSGLQLNTAPGSVTGVVSAGADLVAAGNFNRAGATVVSNIARWNGATWSDIGTPQAQEAVGQWLGAPLASAILSGQLRPARWDGATWVSDGSPAFTPYAFHNDGSAVWAGGGGLGVGFLRFDGSTWTALQSPWAPGMRGLPSPVFGLLNFNGSLYQAGASSLAGADDHWLTTSRVVSWDGNTWTSTPPLPVAPWSLATYGGALVTGGQPGVYRLDPGVWTRLGGTFGGAVLAMVQHGADLIAVGDFYGAGSSAAESIARWNGTSWSAIGSGFEYASGNSPRAVVSYGGEIVVGGYLFSSGGAPVNNLVRWNGSAFQDFAGGADGGVAAIAISGADLLVGGAFTHVGGVEAHGAARWNGSTWTALGDNAEYVTGFREHAGRLFAVGEFIDAEGEEVYGAAVWTGERWYPLGSGVDGQAYTLDFLGDELYVGGTFGWAYGKPSFNIASLPSVSLVGVGGTPRASELSLVAGPNPSRSSTRFTLSLPSAGHVRLTVHDVSGRVVAVLADEDRAAGQSFATWTGAAPPGIYLATIDVGGSKRTTRVVRLD